MNVDDAGRRAGTALRDRFDRLPAPPLGETAPRRPRSGRTAVLTGVAAALVVALLIALVAPWGEDDQRAAGPGGTWKRFEQRTAFGPGAFPTVITPWRGKLLALGNARASQAFAGPDPAAWTSNDGSHWERIPVTAPPSRFNGFSSAATRGRVAVATASVEDHVEFWRSTDGAHWRSVEMAVRTGPTTEYTVTRRPRGFVAVSPSPLGLTAAYTSHDGRRWSSVANEHDDVDHRTGLFSGGTLGRESISLWGVVPGTTRPLVFRSRDRIRWERITDAKAPDRLALPLVGNHSRSRVLGIQFDPFPSSGGRLWWTRDGATWTQIESFHQQMPVGNPDHLVQAGRWWVLGGNTGASDRRRQTTMWVSPDLKRWYEMPARFRGPKNGGTGMLVVEHDGRVVGWSRPDHSLWIWTPPE